MPKEPFEFKNTAAGTGAPVGTDAVPDGIAAMMPSTNPSVAPPDLATIRQVASGGPATATDAPAPVPTSKVLGPDGQPRRMVQGNVQNRSNIPFRPGDDIPEPMPKGTKVQAFQPAPGDIIIGGM